MQREKIIPTVMVRNEERYIAAVLRPLVATFGRVLLGDTGSTDATRDIARGIAGVEIIEYGVRSAFELTKVRIDLGNRAAAAGAEMQLLCDGDELYCRHTLEALVAYQTPPHGVTGFTKMCTLDVDEQGQLWELNDYFSRQALIPVPCQWHGDYPFDIPESFDHPAGFFYCEPPAGYRYHALHLHRLERSGRDGEVLWRTHKRFKFSLQDIVVPRTVPFDYEQWTNQ